MEFKYSKYNHCITNKHGELLIYNSYSNSFVKIRGDKNKRIQESILNLAKVSDFTKRKMINLENTVLLFLVMKMKL